MDGWLARSAQLSNVLALLPAGYCAYGTYVLLHSKSLPPGQPSIVNPSPPGAPPVSMAGVLLSLGLFVLCVAIGAILNFVVIPRRQTSASSPSRVVAIEHRTVAAPTPEELRRQCCKLGGEFASILILCDKPLESIPDDDLAEFIDVEISAESEELKTQLSEIVIEFDRLGLSNDLLAGSNKTLKSALEGTIAGISEVQQVIAALRQAARTLERRYGLKSDANSAIQAIPSPSAIRTAQPPGPEIILSAMWPSKILPPIQRPTVFPFDNSHERPFTVNNESEIVAVNVKVRDIDRNGRRAEFPLIPIVRKGSPERCVPHIVGEEDIYKARSLAALFPRYSAKGWDTGKMKDCEYTVPVITDYEDMAGCRWETEQAMTYNEFLGTATFRFVARRIRK